MNRKTKFSFNHFMLSVWAMSGTHRHYIDWKRDHIVNLKKIFDDWKLKDNDLYKNEKPK